MKYPRGLAFDGKTGLLYIAELNAHRIAVMDLSTEQVVQTIGRGQGTDLDQFNNPLSVALDGYGNLLVADLRNFRVVVWNISGDTPAPVTSFQAQSNSRSVCVDADGYVIVGGNGLVAMW